MVEIIKNPNSDTRTAHKDVTFEEFQKANDMHINDVNNVMKEISNLILDSGSRHDHTKKEYEKLYYDNFMDTLCNGTDFISNKWYQMHVNTERHHLLSSCPEDVNLIDVIEMIADCVCAGLSRSGNIYNLKISPEILNKAVLNTVELIKDMIIVKEPDIRKISLVDFATKIAGIPLNASQIIILDKLQEAHNNNTKFICMIPRGGNRRLLFKLYTAWIAYNEELNGKEE